MITLNKNVKIKLSVRTMMSSGNGPKLPPVPKNPNSTSTLYNKDSSNMPKESKPSIIEITKPIENPKNLNQYQVYAEKLPQNDTKKPLISNAYSKISQKYNPIYNQNKKPISTENPIEKKLKDHENNIKNATPPPLPQYKMKNYSSLESFTNELKNLPRTTEDSNIKPTTVRTILMDNVHENETFVDSTNVLGVPMSAMLPNVPSVSLSSILHEKAENLQHLSNKASETKTTFASLETQDINRFKNYIAEEILLLKEKEKNLIQEYKELNDKYKNNIETTMEKIKEFKNFFKKLENHEEQCHSILPKNITRDELEYMRFFPEMFEPTEDAQIAAKNFLTKKNMVTCYTIEQYEHEISRKKEGLKLLETYGKVLHEPLLFEILRRLNIITNNDAIFNGDDMYDKILIVEGEGFTIKSDVYKSLSQKVSSEYEKKPFLLTEFQFSEIFDNISKGNLKVYIFKHGIHNIEPNTNKLLESSDEIHMNVTTTFTDNANNKIVVCAGHFTSNTDDSTVSIAPKQYINKDFGVKNKEQRFRPYTQFVLVPMDKVKEYPEATSFCLETNVEGCNIQQCLITAIKKNETILRENPLRKYHNFTREKLLEISENYVKTKLKISSAFLSNLENKLNNLTENKRNEKKQIMQNQLKNAENNSKKNQLLKFASAEYKEMKENVVKEIKNEKRK